MLKETWTQLRLSFMFVIVFTVITGLVYPGVVTLLGQVLFPRQANGSLIVVNLDGNTPSGSYLGKDLSLLGGSASAYIGMARLYNIINGPSYGEHQVVITASPGFRLYTFTFG